MSKSPKIEMDEWIGRLVGMGVRLQDGTGECFHSPSISTELSSYYGNMSYKIKKCGTRGQDVYSTGTLALCDLRLNVRKSFFILIQPLVSRKMASENVFRVGYL